MEPRSRFEKEERRPLAASTDGSSSSLDWETADVLYYTPRSDERRDRTRFYLCSLVFAFLVAGVSFVAGAKIGNKIVNLDRSCATHTTQWSPVLNDVKIKYAMKSFNGSFMHENIYRGHPSPKVDQAWEALGINSRAGVISEEDGLASGLTPSHVQRNKKYGGGFLVNVEGMHHLHCLNLVRQALYYNFDYYRKLGTHAFLNDDEVVKYHVTHCLDTVRQVLMCNVDTGILGQVWTFPDSPEAFPDFNTRHKCKNYADVAQWAINHQAPPHDQLPPDYLAMPKKGDVHETTP